MSSIKSKSIIVILLVFMQANNAYSNNTSIYFPVGIKWRNYTISPLFELENEYESNIFKTSRNEKDDYTFHLKPSLNIRSNWSRHALDLTVRGDISLHQNYEQEDAEDIFLDLSGRLDVMRDSYATAKFYWSNRHEERGEVDNGGINGPVEYDTIGGILQYEHQFNRIRLNVGNDISYLDYGNGISLLDNQLVQDNLRNRYTDTATVQLSYDITARIDAFVRGQYNFLDYDSNVDRNGFNRDSYGYEINAGFTFDITRELYGEIFVGYRQQFYDDPGFSDTSDFTWGLGGSGLKWNATNLTTVSLTIDDDIFQTTQSGASNANSSGFNLQVDHELLRYLLLSAHGGYTSIEYQGSPSSPTPGQNISSREDEIIILGFSAKYLYSRNFYLKGDYTYRQRESNIPDNDYTAHRVLFSIGLQM